MDFKALEVWFVTGSQHLYGEEALAEVAKHSEEIAKGLAATPELPVKVVFKPVMTTPESMLSLCREANNAKGCIGLIMWMHTFSPAKMWIAGLKALRKPFVHLHTQYNRELPWSTIDMDFMNLNQAAHGDREFGFIGTRMRLNRKVVWLLAGRGRSKRACDLDAGRVRMGRRAEHEGRAFRGQHATGRCNGRRQG